MEEQQGEHSGAVAPPAAPPPPPPPPPTPEEIAEAERQAQLEAEERGRQFEDQFFWAGIRPSDRLRSAKANVYQLVRLDRPLVDAIAEADPDVQRRIARWAARRACEESGLASLPWVIPALEAVERGDALPPPFDNHAAMWKRLLGGPAEFRAELVVVTEPSTTPPQRIMPEAAALPSLEAALDPDPLKAALDALAAAAVTFQDRCPELFRELRATFAV